MDPLYVAWLRGRKEHEEGDTRFFGEGSFIFLNARGLNESAV